MDPVGVEIGFGRSYEEHAGLVRHVQPGEIDLSAIHQVGRARLGKQQIKRVNVMQLAVRNVDEA